MLKALLFAGLVGFGSLCVAAEFRTIDGSNNNLANPDWGQAHTEFIRTSTAAYDDGLSVPRGGDPSSLPSARAISNALSAQSSSVPSGVGISDWFWQWGQLIDHDLDFTAPSNPAEAFNIVVPMGDPSFDPFNTGMQTIGMNRSKGTVGGVRQQTNEITSYIDASMIYGSDATRAAALRTGVGMLTTAIADNGEVLPMYNTPGLPNEMGNGSNFFLSGDARANEQVGLTAAHTLFVREHNRIAVDLKSRLDLGETALVNKRDAAIANSSLVNNESDFIYESARKVVGAQVQKITYDEFLPLLIGSTPGEGGSYDPSINASVSNEFATAAFRVGHTMLSPTLKRIGANGQPAAEGDIALQDAFFNPGEIQSYGVDSLLLGLASQTAQEIDTLLVDDVRNFLFGPPGAGGFDLASLNLQRGRDHGMGSLNEVRADLGLTTHADFLSVTGGDATLADALASVYSSVDDIDLWIGGLAEQQISGGVIGETFAEIIEDQFARSRLGDRFFYTEELDHLLSIDPTFESLSLSDLILRNSSIVSMQSNAFLAVPEPSSVAVLLIGLMLVRCRRS